MTPQAVKTAVKAMALIAFTVGGFGSVLCIPFAMSTNLWFIGVAGIYFIAGGIMIVGGLGTYAYMVNNEK